MMFMSLVISAHKRHITHRNSCLVRSLHERLRASAGHKASDVLLVPLLSIVDFHKDCNLVEVTAQDLQVSGIFTLGY